MEITYTAINPQAQGLERVAKIYVSKGFDVRSAARPSAELVTVVTTAEAPKYIRELFRVFLQKQTSKP